MLVLDFIRKLTIRLQMKVEKEKKTQFREKKKAFLTLHLPLSRLTTEAPPT